MLITIQSIFDASFYFFKLKQKNIYMYMYMRMITVLKSWWLWHLHMKN